MTKVGTRVRWDDDGTIHDGEIVRLYPQKRRSQGSHMGTLYVVRFDDGPERNFDDYDIDDPNGRLELI